MVERSDELAGHPSMGDLFKRLYRYYQSEQCEPGRKFFASLP